jgi:ApbE superfamily uncharacterized protein (UPF0280 family)
VDDDRELYRRWVTHDELVGFRVTVEETDLLIRASSDLSGPAEDAVRDCRRQIEDYIARDPDFETALEPYDVTDAPDIVRKMADAGRIAGVGPMAAVAGAVAQLVGEKLTEHSPEVIVENGGDLYINVAKEIRVGMYAGTSPFTGRLALLIAPEKTPLGMCTSSGTVGHSLSFGKADAVTVICRCAAAADAYATAYANRLKTPDGIDGVLALGEQAEEVLGLLIIIGSTLGTWGDITLAEK